MQINKIKVKYGKDYYIGYFWVETGINKKPEIVVSYEGIKKSIPSDEIHFEGQNRLAEKLFFNLLGDL